MQHVRTLRTYVCSKMDRHVAWVPSRSTHPSEVDGPGSSVDVHHEVDQF